VYAPRPSYYSPPDMQCDVLGPVEVRIGGVPVDLGGPRQRFEQARAHAGIADALRRAGRDDADQWNTAHALFLACGLSEQAARQEQGERRT
jgi:hypothetical protein